MRQRGREYTTGATAVQIGRIVHTRIMIVRLSHYTLLNSNPRLGVIFDKDKVVLGLHEA